MQEFLHQISLIKAKEEILAEYASSKGEYFDLFNVCGVDAAETAHSKILATLLSNSRLKL